MTPHSTNRTIRHNGQWVKITRDPKAHNFTFARGYNGSFEATEKLVYPFAIVPTWADAEDLATSKLATY